MDEAANDNRLALLEEWHSSEVSWAGNTKLTKHASVWLAEGIDASVVYGLSDLDRDASRYLQVADHLPIEEASRLVKSLQAALSRTGIGVSVGAFYDE